MFMSQNTFTEVLKKIANTVQILRIVCLNS